MYDTALDNNRIFGPLRYHVYLRKETKANKGFEREFRFARELEHQLESVN
jgi:hypothetical protein